MWVVSYDIGDDDLRLRVARVLERFGSRVQQSVFECPVDGEGIGELERTLSRDLARAPLSASDSIRLYRVCESCVRASRQFEDGSAGTGDAPACVIV